MSRLSQRLSSLAGAFDRCGIVGGGEHQRDGGCGGEDAENKSVGARPCGLCGEPVQLRKRAETEAGPEGEAMRREMCQ